MQPIPPNHGPIGREIALMETKIDLLIQQDPGLLKEIERAITLAPDAIDFGNKPIVHFTTEPQISEVLKGIQNDRGKPGRLSGKGLCTFCEAEEVVAGFAKGGTRATVSMKGNLNAEFLKTTPVAKFKVQGLRCTPELLKKGIFPLYWAKSPIFEEWMAKEFGIVLIEDANIQNLVGKRPILVFTERAHPNLLRWQGATTLKGDPVMSELFARNLSSTPPPPPRAVSKVNWQNVCSKGLRVVNWGSAALLILKINQDFKQGFREKVRSPMIVLNDPSIARGMITGAVRAVSNLILGSIDMAAESIDVREALQSFPNPFLHRERSGQSRLTLALELFDVASSGRPITSSMSDHAPSPEVMHEETMAVARQWRIWEKQVINYLFKKWELNRDPSGATIHDLMNYMGKIEIPKDFFLWTPQQQAAWGHGLVAKAESCLTPQQPLWPENPTFNQFLGVIHDHHNRMSSIAPLSEENVDGQHEKEISPELNLPENFIEWDVAQQAEWGHKLAAKAETVLTETITNYRQRDPNETSSLAEDQQDSSSLSMQDLKKANGNQAIQDDAILPILTEAETFLDPQCIQDLEKRLFEHPEILLAALKEATPGQLAQMIDIANKRGEPLTAEQVETLLASASQIIDEKTLSKDLSVAEKNAKKIQSKEIANKISIAFDAIDTLGHAILGCVEWAQSDKMQRERNLQAHQQFDYYMNQLGLDAKITEFYHKPLQSIKDLLERKISKSCREDANRWVETAEAYKKAVQDTKQILGRCFEAGKDLNQVNNLRQLSRQLRVLQERRDAYYSAKSSALQKVNIVATLVQIAGGVASLANPIAGAAIAGAGQMAKLGVSALAQSNASNWQNSNAQIEAGRQALALIAQGNHDAKDLMQRYVTSLLERQRQQRELLLTSGYFQPLRHQQNLKNAIFDAENNLEISRAKYNEVQSKLTLAQQELDTQKAIDIDLKNQTPYQNLSISRENGKITKISGETSANKRVTVKGTSSIEACLQSLKTIEGFKTSIVTLATTVSNLTVEADQTKGTVGVDELHLEDLRAALEESKRNSELPLYLRSDADQLTLEVRIQSSDQHLMALDPLRKDPKILADWLEAKRINIQLHGHQAQRQLYEANEEEIPKLLPQIAVDSIERQTSLQGVIQQEQINLQALVAQEDNQRSIFEATEKEAQAQAVILGENHEEVKALWTKAAVEQETLAGITDKRLEMETRLNICHNATMHERQISMFSFEFLMRLSPAMRKDCCSQVLKSLETTLTQELNPQEQSFCRHQVLYYSEIERAADSEQWQTADENQRPGLFDGLFSSSQQRQARIQTNIDLLKSSEGDHKQQLSALEKQLLVEQRSRQYHLVGHARDISNGTLRVISGNRTNPLEASILGGHAEFLEGVKREALPQQLPQLLSAIEGLIQQWGPDWYKDKQVIAGRMISALASAAAYLSSVGIGVWDLWNRSSLLQKEDPTSSSAVGLLCKMPHLLINSYISPTLKGITYVIQLVNLYDAWNKVLGLPVTLEKQISGIKDELEKFVKEAHNGFSTILESQNEQFDNLDERIRLLSKDVNKQLLLLENMRLAELFTEDNRRITDKSMHMRDQLNLMEAQPNVLQQLLDYSSDCYADTLNGKDRARSLALEDIIHRPDLFVGVIGSRLERTAKDTQNRQFPAPALLLRVGESFTQWRTKSKAHILPHEAEKIISSLAMQCDALLWLHGQCGTQLNRTSKALKKLKTPFVEKHQERCKHEVRSPTYDLKHFNAAETALSELAKRFTLTKRIIRCMTAPLPDVTEKINVLYTTAFEVARSHALKVGVGTGVSGYGVFLGAVLMAPPVAASLLAVIPLTFLGLAIAGVGTVNTIDALDPYNQLKPSRKITLSIIEKVKRSSLTLLFMSKDSEYIRDHIEIEWLNAKDELKISTLALRKSQSGDPKYDFRASLPAEAVSDLKGEPRVHVTTRLSGRNTQKINLDFHQDSWVQEADISVIDILSRIIDLNKLEDAETRCRTLGRLYRQTFSKPDSLEPAEINAAKAFKKWLGAMEVIPHHGNLMLPLAFPAELLSRIQKKISIELDHYFQQNQAILEPSYAWQQDLDAVSGKITRSQLVLNFCDEAGKIYYAFPLIPISGNALRSLVQNSEIEDKAAEASAQMLFLLYGAHLKLGLPTEGCMPLSSGKGILAYDELTEEGGHYEQLRAYNPPLIRAELGEALYNQVEQRKFAFGDSKEFKKYKNNYLLAVALLKLSYGNLTQEHHRTTVQEFLSLSGFPEPTASTLFDDLSYQQESPGNSENLLSIMEMLPYSSIKVEVESLKETLGK